MHFEDSVTRAIDHLWIRVADVEASKRFYEAIAAHAHIGLGTDTPERVSFNGERGSFSVVAGDHPTENVHMAFPANENQAVDDFHRGRDRGRLPRQWHPGERPEYHAGYYAAFVLDPDGNSVELVNHNR